MDNSKEIDGWKYSICKDSTSVTPRVELSSSSSAAIGLYHLNVVNGVKKVATGDFLLIFNPWCKDDDVYMEDENLLSEYILSTSTNIYTGSYDSIISKKWRLDQVYISHLMITFNLHSLIQIQSEQQFISWIL